MALPSSGPLSLNDIQVEFGGSNPIELNEYYGAAAGIPTSGAIGIDDFYGASSAPSVVETAQSTTGSKTITLSQAYDSSHTFVIVAMSRSFGDGLESPSYVTIDGVTTTKRSDSNAQAPYIADCPGVGKSSFYVNVGPGVNFAYSGAFFVLYVVSAPLTFHSKQYATGTSAAVTIAQQASGFLIASCTNRRVTYTGALGGTAGVSTDYYYCGLTGHSIPTTTASKTINISSMSGGYTGSRRLSAVSYSS